MIENKFLIKRRINLCAGNKSENEYKKFNVIKAHSWDFDETLEIKKRKKIRFMRFLNHKIMLPYHSWATRAPA